MRKRFVQKRQNKRALLLSALENAEAIIATQLALTEEVDLATHPCRNFPFYIHTDDRYAEAFEEEIECNGFINWSTLNPNLDPASGELNEERAKRKRDQVESLVSLVEREIKFLENQPSRGLKDIVIVDFGAGSGHLGILVAARNPHTKVILAEQKEYSVNVARQRIVECGLTNVSIFSEDIKKLLSDADFEVNIGVSLHSCGILTDISLQLCFSKRASFVITPCCYGQIAKPPPGFVDFAGTTSQSLKLHRSSKIFQENPEILGLISSGADYSIGFDVDFTNEPEFLLAKRCMRVIDFDRMFHICESPLESDGKYLCTLSSLQPINSSPKNDVIIGRFSTS